MTPGEMMERAALESLHAAAPAALRGRLGLQWRRLGAGAVSVAAALPASAIVVNRALGLDPAAAAFATRVYARAGVRRYFVSGGAQPEGLVPVRGWRKFGRGRLAPVPAVSAPFPIRPLTPDDGPAFGALVAAAFDLGPQAAPWLACLPGAPGWTFLGAFSKGRLVGAGGVLRSGDHAWTDWGATAPAARGQGVQLSLLAARVRLALEGGARAVHTCTGEAVPGEPQHSYANILRCGFAEGDLRPNWAPPKPPVRLPLAPAARIA
jgi:GNAT superfamily N-acetyltransferase